MSIMTITPTAIDALIDIDAVQVVSRHRRDLGDVRALADSIEDVGLLNPITLTRDGRLVAGERRLAACRLLRWESIPARFVDSFDDVVKLLHAERDENICRTDMLPSELASLGEALHALEADAARKRRLSSLKQNRCGELSTTVADGADGKSRDAVGEALGMSGRTYWELQSVYRVANDEQAPEPERALAQAALDKMDSGVGIFNAGREFRAKLRTKHEAQEAKAAATVEPEPKPGRRTAGSAEDRRVRIREMAAQGHSSHQIGEQVGMLPVTVRKIAREHDIEIPADTAIGKGHRRIDSNRIVRETVQSIEDLGMGLKLIDYDELDSAEAENWTASLSESIRVLNRLNKRLKEMVQ